MQPSDYFTLPLDDWIEVFVVALPIFFPLLSGLDFADYVGSPELAMVWIAVLIALVGLIIGTLPSVMPDVAAKLLRYYWFRLTGLREYQQVPFILAHVTADFRSSALIGEELEVGMRITRLGTKSFDAEYRIETTYGSLSG